MFMDEFISSLRELFVAYCIALAFCSGLFVWGCCIMAVQFWGLLFGWAPAMLVGRIMLEGLPWTALISIPVLCLALSNYIPFRWLWF